MIKIPDIEWCEVPAGEFIMGSDDGLDRERPRHVVKLNYDYQATKYPITNAQYSLFVADKGYTTRRYWTAAGREWKGKRMGAGREWGEPFTLSNHPVVGVSWYEAVAYCRWLTEVMRGCGELAEGWLIRLPTEAEWEKAARGTDGRTYPWGEGFDVEKANSEATEVKSTSTVGIFPDGASPYGCHDMAGNVWEWCTTKWGKLYPYQVKNEWTKDYLAVETIRSVRGGSWDYVSDGLRCAYRGYLNPYDNNFSRGFRCFFVPIF